MAGAPTKLTPEVQAEICLSLAGGIYIEQACILAGISIRTFYNWKERGETGEEPYAAFLQAATRAEAQAERRAVAYIQRAGEEDPRHLQWWLERKHSDRWGRKDRLQQEVSGSIVVEVPLVQIERDAGDGAADTDSA